MDDKRRLIIKIIKYIFFFLFLILMLVGAINLNDIRRSIGITMLSIVVLGYFVIHGFVGGIKHFLVSFIKALGYVLIIFLGTSILLYLMFKIGWFEINL